MKAKLSTILTVLMLVLCCGCFMTFWSVAKNVEADELPQKAYSYSLSQHDNKIIIIGEYTDKTKYILSNNATFDNVTQIIDADRLENFTYADAEIYFDSIKVFDSYISLVNGNYTLSGTLTGLGYSTYGLIYVNGANVVFENANFTNNGLSYLVKNEGGGNLTFNSGKFSSNYVTIFSSNSGNLSIFGGEFTSKNASVINFSPTTLTNLTIQKTQETTISILSFSNAVVANGANVIVGDCSISADEGYAVKLTNSTFQLSGQPSINSQLCLDKSFDAFGYLGTKLFVTYEGVITSGSTVAITNANVAKFELANEGYTFRQSGEDIVIFKTSNVIYNDNRGFIANLPYDETNYIIGESATIKFVGDKDVKDNILNRYNFLGWSSVQGSTVAEFEKDGLKNYTFGEDNLVLYAVWQPITFTITYQGVDGIVGTNPNPTEYNVDQTVTFSNLEKQYYDFSGWTMPGILTPQKDFVLPKDVWGNITLTANWTYTKYDIEYHGIEQDLVQKLKLKTNYTVGDEAIIVNTSKFLVDGYSCYGVFFDENKTLAVDETIHFKIDEQSQNSQEFKEHNTIGQTINFYIDLQIYHNSTGNGSQSKPFVIENPEQFAIFVTGEKTVSKNGIYVKLNNNLTLGELQHSYTGFEKINFDGNGKTITVTQLNQLDDTFAVFPVVRNSTIQNLKISSNNQIELPITQNAMVGCAFGEVVGCNLKNIDVDVNVLLSCNDVPITIKVGGLAVKTENTVINNVKNFGDISVVVSAINGSVNVYCSGIVGGEAEQTKIINSQSSGKLQVSMPNTANETRAYISALANLGLNNKVYNCFADCQITYNQENNNVAYVSGGVMVLAENNVAKNLVWLGEFDVQDDEWSNVQVSNFVGANISYCFVENCWLAENFACVRADQNLMEINSLLEKYSTEIGNKLLQWYYTLDQKVSFNPLLKVTFINNGVSHNETRFISNFEDGAKVVFPFDTLEYKFVNWQYQNGQAVDWKNVKDSVITVYGNYQHWDVVEMQKVGLLVVAELLIFVGIILIMELFDCKKSVKFVLDGKVVAKIRIARRKRFAVPKDYENMMWFFDLEGKKPYTNQKMPFHPIKLFAFTGEKQEKFEKYWKEQEKIKQEAIEKAKNEKLQKRNLKKERKANLRKQNSEQKKKNLKQNDDQSKITIIKKEIKIINNSEKVEDFSKGDKKDD